MHGDLFFHFVVPCQMVWFVNASPAMVNGAIGAGVAFFSAIPSSITNQFDSVAFHGSIVNGSRGPIFDFTRDFCNAQGKGYKRDCGPKKL